MLINKSLKIDNIKANIKYFKNTGDEYVIKYNNEVLDGDMTIEDANLTDGDTIEATLQDAETLDDYGV